MIVDYRKFISALLTAALSAVAAQTIGGHITQVGWVNVGVAVATAALVVLSPNIPGSAPYTKALVAGIGAGLALFASIVGAGSLASVTPAEWTQVGLAVLNTVAVTFVRNGSVPAPAVRPAVRS